MIDYITCGDSWCEMKKHKIWLQQNNQWTTISIYGLETLKDNNIYALLYAFDT